MHWRTSYHLYENPIASRLVFSFDFPIANCLSNMNKVALSHREVKRISGHEILMIKKSIYTMYIQPYSNMMRRMKAIITQIESVVTPSGNSGHVVVPKAWIGKEAIVTLKENRTKGKK
jgi:putative transposon-encoded protein